jgi:hypothetical protein
MAKKCPSPNNSTGTRQFRLAKAAHWQDQAQFFAANGKYGFQAYGL